MRGGPGVRQQWEIREMGGTCVGKDGLKHTEEEISRSRQSLTLGRLLQIPIPPGGSARKSFKTMLLKVGPQTGGQGSPLSC